MLATLPPSHRALPSLENRDGTLRPLTLIGDAIFKLQGGDTTFHAIANYRI
jgi:hypothetical protein